MNLLAWYNLIFLLPLAVGLLLIFGNMAGIGADADADVDHDADADHDHDAGSKLFLHVLTALGVGKVPLSIVMMLMCMIFGGIGMMLNFILMDLIVKAEVFALIPLGSALFCRCSSQVRSPSASTS